MNDDYALPVEIDPFSRLYYNTSWCTGSYNKKMFQNKYNDVGIAIHYRFYIFPPVMRPFATPKAVYSTCS